MGPLRIGGAIQEGVDFAKLTCKLEQTRSDLLSPRIDSLNLQLHCGKRKKRRKVSLFNVTKPFVKINDKERG